MATSSLDSLDLGIIRELQDDGRCPFREIAHNLSVPEATVRTRVKRLQDQYVLQLFAFTNPSKLGRAKLIDTAPAQHDPGLRPVLPSESDQPAAGPRTRRMSITRHRVGQ